MAEKKKHGARPEPDATPQPGSAGGTPTESGARPQAAHADRVPQLERELETTREELQGTIEQLVCANEELRASNEEIVTMNEELRSGNEELRASKGALQSLNEQLGTVNDQLRDKVQELEAANNDMANLFNSTDIATVLLDTELRIKRFTPAASRLFTLVATDHRRLLGNIARRFTDDDLLRDARDLLRDLMPREKEVRGEDGRWYVRRIIPYHTLDNRIDGVVITFVDVTERKRAADAVVRRLAAIVEGSADAIFSKDLDGTIRTWNRGAERLYGYTAAEAVGRSIRMTVPDDRAAEWTRAMGRVARGEHVEQMETQRLCKNGRRITVAVTYSPLRDGDGKVVGASAITRDLTERKKAEQELRLQGQVAANLAEGVSLVRTRDGVIVYTNDRFDQMFGYGPGELPGKHVSVLNAAVERQPGETANRIIRALRENGTWKGEVHNVKKDGTPFWTEASASTFEHPEFGTVWVSARSDITERKRAEEALRASEERFRLLFEKSLDAILVAEDQGGFLAANPAACQLLGYSRDQLLTMNVADLRVSRGTPAGELYQSYLSRGEEIGEFAFVRPDGQERIAEYAAAQIAPGQHLSVLRDVTQRRQAERALRESEEQQRAVLASLPAHIAVVDRSGRIVVVNPAWEQFARDNSGVADRCSVGANYLEVCRSATGPYAEEAPRVAEGLGAILADTAGEFKVEYPCHGGGQERWFLLHATRLRGEEGGAVLSHTAITSRVKAELRARANEYRLQAILNTAADAIVTIDTSGIIRSVNAGAERMFGYAAAEMVGRNVTMLLPSPYRELHDGYIARYLRTGEKHIIGRTREVPARREDGSIFPTELAVSEVDHLGLFIGTLRDLSERKQLERDVVEAASLEQRRIGRDLHDSVGQELTALNILARDLAETLRSDPETADQLVGRITRGLQRSQRELRAVLRGLLPVSVDAQGVMAALADLADRTQRDGNVACRFDCSEPVALADNFVATHLYLIAQEAVLNAARHARARNVRISLRSDDVVELSVRDDGIGMPAALSETQGLGLRIMRNRAAIIGATLTIEPARPTGTVVTCLMRRRDDEREKGEATGPGADRR